MVDLEDLVEQLRAEPLWYASLGSKELFHSNMLGWIVDEFPEQARSIFKPWLRPEDGIREDRPPSREEHHLDLVIELAGYAPLVIENKTFSFPDEDQLESYALKAVPGLEKRLNGQKCDLILLSLMCPGWTHYQAGDRTWRWASYREVAGRIVKQFPNPNGYPEETVTHYGRMLKLLCDIEERVSIIDAGEPLALAEPTQRLLSRARLDGLAAKVRAQQLVHRIRQRLDSEGLGMRVEAGFTHGTPLIEGFRPFRVVGGEEDRIGWQYQHGQWRHAFSLLSMKGTASRERERREAFAATNHAWFDFNRLAETAGIPAPGFISPRNVGFRRYDPDFIYKYRQLARPTVSQLIELAVASSRAAVEVEQTLVSDETTVTRPSHTRLRSA